MNRLRKPGSALARRPVAPFLVATLLALLVVLAINDLVLREPWRLPHMVAIVGPLLAAAASAALRMAATRSIDVEELLMRPIVRLNVDACARGAGRQAGAHHRRAPARSAPSSRARCSASDRRRCWPST